PLGTGVEIRGVPERTAKAGDVRHATCRAGSQSRGRPPFERLARGALLRADDADRLVADAQLSLAVRRCPQQAEQKGAVADPVHPLARLLAGELPVLRELRSRSVARAGAG